MKILINSVLTFFTLSYVYASDLLASYGASIEDRKALQLILRQSYSKEIWLGEEFGQFVFFEVEGGAIPGDSGGPAYFIVDNKYSVFAVGSTNWNSYEPIGKHQAWVKKCFIKEDKGATGNI